MIIDCSPSNKSINDDHIISVILCESESFVLSGEACKHRGFWVGSGSEMLQIWWRSFDFGDAALMYPHSPLPPSLPPPPQGDASPSGWTQRQEVPARRSWGTETHEQASDCKQPAVKTTEGAWHQVQVRRRVRIDEQVCELRGGSHRLIIMWKLYCWFCVQQICVGRIMKGKSQTRQKKSAGHCFCLCPQSMSVHGQKLAVTTSNTDYRLLQILIDHMWTKTLNFLTNTEFTFIHHVSAPTQQLVSDNLVRLCDLLFPFISDVLKHLRAGLKVSVSQLALLRKLS